MQWDKSIINSVGGFSPPGWKWWATYWHHLPMVPFTGMGSLAPCPPPVFPPIEWYTQSRGIYTGGSRLSAGFPSLGSIWSCLVTLCMTRSLYQAMTDVDILWNSANSHNTFCYFGMQVVMYYIDSLTSQMDIENPCGLGLTPILWGRG